MIDMTNIAYSPEYLAVRKQSMDIYRQENLTNTNQLCFYDGYRVERKSYFQIKQGVHFGASEATLHDADGADIYHWNNIDDDGEFITMLHHKNGHDYLLFRVDLYGYGVYDLTDKKDFYYVPKGPESFIWTDAHYNQGSNVLAVEGCYWACPYGVHLVDFHEPLQESKWVDLVAVQNGGYNEYSGIDFLRWEDSTLILTAEKRREADKKVITAPEEIFITQKEYMRWF